VGRGAREKIAANKRPSNAGRRFWELSGGLTRCGACGYAMTAFTTTPEKAGQRYYYYACRSRHKELAGDTTCERNWHYPATKLESRVWSAVSELLLDPERLRAGLDEMIEAERRRHGSSDPDKEAKVWADKLAEVDRKREAYIDLAADSTITRDELTTKLAALEETRKTARAELDRVRSQATQIEELAHDRDALLERYANMIPEALEELTPEERHRLYNMLRLEVKLYPDGDVEISGLLSGELEFSKNGGYSSKP